MTIVSSLEDEEVCLDDDEAYFGLAEVALLVRTRLLLLLLSLSRSRISPPLLLDELALSKDLPPAPVVILPLDEE
jgi:hypothetical protein